jgi:RiboL-PSP-HEPN
MERFNDAVAAFNHAMDRAKQMVVLYDALSALRPGDPANDDALRSAYIQAVSSFDFFAHELTAIEARFRCANSVVTRNITLPMEIMTIADYDTRVAAVETNVRQSNSYKAFVDPGKLGQMLSCYCDEPWSKIAAYVNRDINEADRRSAERIKGQLKSIWKRRNKIAHEADVNPTLAGISLWPIDKQDAELTINFVKQIGDHLPMVICDVLANGDTDVEDIVD